jgi:hypothetical protein
MRCSFCGLLDQHGTHHPAPDGAAAVCVRCLAAVDAGLRGAPPGEPYTDAISLLLIDRSGARPVEQPLAFPVAPCGWCGRSDEAEVPMADMLGAVSMCAPCAGALSLRGPAAPQSGHYRQSAALRTDPAISGDRYRLDEATLRRPDPSDDDALALADVRGIRVRAWATPFTLPWEGVLRWTTAALLLVPACWAVRALGGAHALRLVALGVLTALVGATLRRSLTRHHDERRLELVRPDGTTFLLGLDAGADEPAALATAHAPVLTAALGALGRTPCPRFVHVSARTAVRVAADGTSAEPSPAEPVAAAARRGRA